LVLVPTDRFWSDHPVLRGHDVGKRFAEMNQKNHTTVRVGCTIPAGLSAKTLICFASPGYSNRLRDPSLCNMIRPHSLIVIFVFIIQKTPGTVLIELVRQMKRVEQGGMELVGVLGGLPPQFSFRKPPPSDLARGDPLS
jgi:hypothetical protein